MAALPPPGQTGVMGRVPTAKSQSSPFAPPNSQNNQATNFLGGVGRGFGAVGNTIGTPFSAPNAPAAPAVPGAVSTQSTPYSPQGPAAGAGYTPTAPAAPAGYSPTPFTATPQRVAPGAMVAAPQVSQTFTGAVNPSRMVGSPLAGGGFQNQLPGAAGFGPMSQALEDATFERGLNRIQPEMDEMRSRSLQRLADQGIPVGSEAYAAEMNRLDRGQADARENLALSSVAAGRQEQDRLTRLAAALRGQEFGERSADRRFQAGEQGRRFGETLASRRFDAGEEGRGFGERLNRAGFQAAESGRNFRERLASDNQFFNQALAGAQFRSGENRFGAQLGEGQRRYDDAAARGDRQFGAQFGEGQRRYDDAALRGDRQFGAGFGEGARRFDAGFNLGQNAQLFNQGAQARGNALSEALLERQLPFQETAQGLGLAGNVIGLAGVQQPNFYGAPGVDHSGNVWGQFGAEQARANEPKWWHHLLGAAGTLGGGFLAGR